MDGLKPESSKETFLFITAVIGFILNIYQIITIAINFDSVKLLTPDLDPSLPSLTLKINFDEIIFKLNDIFYVILFYLLIFITAYCYRVEFG